MISVHGRSPSRSRRSGAPPRARPRNLRGVLALVAAVVSAASTGCTEGGLPADAAPPAGTAWYEGEVHLTPAAGTLDAFWSVWLRHPPDSVAYFLLDADLAIDSVVGPRVEGWGAGPSPLSDALTRVSVRLATDLAGGDDVRVDFAFRGAPFPEPAPGDINRISPEWIELGIDAFWFPALEGFPWDIGGEARISVPAGWTVVTGATDFESDGAPVVSFPTPTVDLAFVAAPTFEVARSPRFTVFELTGVDAATADLVRIGSECAAWLDARFRDAGPLPHTRVVVTPREDSGYARRGYIVLSDIEGRSTPDLALFVCHEMAHAWNVGSAATRDRWLSEGIAQYLALGFVRSHLGPDAHEESLAGSRERAAGLPPVWTEDARGVPAHAVMYHKAPVVLAELEARVGTPAMESWILALLREEVDTTERALELLEGVAGSQERSWLRGALARGVASGG